MELYEEERERETLRSTRCVRATPATADADMPGCCSDMGRDVYDAVREKDKDKRRLMMLFTWDRMGVLYYKSFEWKFIKLFEARELGRGW